MDAPTESAASSFALSLRWILGIGFAAAALLGFLAVMGPWIYLGRPILESVVAGQLQQSASDAAQSLQLGLTERRREMELAATRLPSSASDKDSLRLFLRRMQEASPFYALIGLIGSDGRFVVTSNGIAEGADVANRDYYLIGRRHTYVSDAHDAMILAANLRAGDAVPRLIDISTPIFDGDRIVGVLAAHLGADWAHEAGAAITRGLFDRFPHARVELRDAGGQILFASGDPGMASQELDANPLSAEATIQGIGETGTLHWSLRVAAPRTDLDSIVRPARVVAAAFGVLAVLLAVTVGVLLAGALARPIEGYTVDAMGIASRPRPHFRRSPAREINDLGAALRVASDELRNRPEPSSAE